MAGMKRFVTYIYAYEEEKKGSNVGFARIEIRGQDARIEIHLRGVYAASAACRVYLFQREAAGGKEATGVTGVLVGEMKLTNGSGDGAVVLKGGRVGASPYGITEMEGLFFVIGEERILMSRWREGVRLRWGCPDSGSAAGEAEGEGSRERGGSRNCGAKRSAGSSRGAGGTEQPDGDARDGAEKAGGSSPCTVGTEQPDGGKRNGAGCAVWVRNGDSRGGDGGDSCHRASHAQSVPGIRLECRVGGALQRTQTGGSV